MSNDDKKMVRVTHTITVTRDVPVDAYMHVLAKVTGQSILQTINLYEQKNSPIAVQEHGVGWDVVHNVDVRHLETWYFTFGYHDVHPITRQPLVHCYVAITATSHEACRDIMFERFGSKWAFPYRTTDMMWSDNDKVDVTWRELIGDEALGMRATNCDVDKKV